MACENKIELATQLNSLYEPSNKPVVLELTFDQKINLEVIKEFRQIKHSN
jgi:hypothetical protein